MITSYLIFACFLIETYSVLYFYSNIKVQGCIKNDKDLLSFFV